MLGLWAVLSPILATDLLNPVLLGVVIYALGSRHPYRNSLAIVAGHTAMYFAFGVVLAIGLESAMDRLNNPRPVDFVIETVLGGVLLWVGYQMARSKEEEKPRDPASDDPGVVKSFVTGVIVNLIGLPFAVPYFAALGQMMRYDLDWSGTLVALAIYNVLYALPFCGVILLRVVLGKRADSILAKINDWMTRGAAVLMPVLLLGIGVLMIVDAVKWFTTGTALF